MLLFRLRLGKLGGEGTAGTQPKRTLRYSPGTCTEDAGVRPREPAKTQHHRFGVGGSWASVATSTALGSRVLAFLRGNEIRVLARHREPLRRDDRELEHEPATQLGSSRLVGNRRDRAKPGLARLYVW